LVRRYAKSRHFIKGIIIPWYFKRYLPAAAAVHAREVVKNPDEKIFSLWFQGEDAAPPLVKSCYRSIRRHCPQEFLVLDDKTLWDYIDLPGFIMDKFKAGTLRRSHLADIARVELLYNHGGFWLDSTCFVVSEIPKFIVDSDFFVFLVGDNKIGNLKISPHSFMQNCFIRARKGAYLLDAWRAMMHAYWKDEKKTFDYFMHQLLFRTLVHNDPRAIDAFANMPHVNQDWTANLWRGHATEPFDQAKFIEMTSRAFFQKLAYRPRYARRPIPGSVADVVTRMNS
jgi:hypothetical protein